MLNYSILDGVYSETIDDTVLVFNSVSENFLTFNNIGSRIWNLMNQKTEYDNIIKIIANEFNAPIETIREDVSDLFYQMISFKILKIG